MANKTRAFGLELINSKLAERDRERGLTMRVQFRFRWFRSFYYVNAFDGHSERWSLKFYNLSDAIYAARDIDKMLKQSQEHAVREATTR